MVEPAKISGEPISALLELLKVPEDRTRYRAKRELAARPTEEVIPALKQWMASLDESGENYEHQMLEALWMHQTHNVIAPDLLKRLLASKDHRARAAATRVLSFWLDDIPDHMELLEKCIADDHPAFGLLRYD